MAKNYQIALTNVSFDNTYENTPRFDSRAEQEAYFGVDTLFVNTPVVNFNLGTMLATSVVVRNNAPILKVLNYNYAIVKDSSENAPLTYYYYFIKSITYDTNEQVVLDLELDVMQTYYIDLTFSQCWVDRAHLNRFLVDGGNVQFNYLASNNYLFERESNEEFAKRLISKYRLGLQIKGKNYADLYAWVKQNISSWLYIYVSAGTYKCYEVNFESGTTRELKDTSLSKINYGFGTYTTVIGSCAVLCYPVYKTPQKIYVADKSDLIDAIELGPFALSQFEINNPDSSAKFYTQKVSAIPPYISNQFSDYAIVDNNLYLYGTIDSNNTSIECAQGDFTAVCTSVDGRGMILVQTQDLLDFDGTSVCVTEELDLSTTYPKTFTKAEVLADSNNPKYNPKLHNADHIELKVSAGYGDGFAYDYQKIDSAKIRFAYTEMLMPDITKILISYLPETDDGIFVQATTNNYTGFIGSNDLSIPYSNDQFSSFIAQNKNFFLQRDINLGVGVFNNFMTSLGSILKGDFGGAFAGATSTIVNQTNDRVQSNLTLDNMRNSKQELHGTQGNAVFNMNIQELGVYVEIFEVLDQQKQTSNDYMQLYGYAYNRLANIKDIDNIRQVYNFVKAKPEIINAPYNLSNIARDKIKSIFSKGIRLWNNGENMFNFNASNYERSLNNEQV